MKLQFTTRFTAPANGNQPQGTHASGLGEIKD